MYVHVVDTRNVLRARVGRGPRLQRGNAFRLLTLRFEVFGEYLHLQFVRHSVRQRLKLHDGGFVVGGRISCVQPVKLRWKPTLASFAVRVKYNTRVTKADAA